MEHIDLIGREKGISTDRIIEALEEAIANAARKNFRSAENLQAFFNRETGEIEVYAYKEVVETVEDPDLEISLAEAQQMIDEAEIGDELAIQKNIEGLGRIAAQTAKQIIFQKVREAERENIFEEYSDRVGELVNGTVKRFEKGNLIIDLGKYEGILRKDQQSRYERYSQGERIRCVIIDVKKDSKDPQIELSRIDPNLLIELFEMEVPEIYDGTIVIKNAVREAGERAKIAVMSKEPDIDPVGACVGMRGSRVQNIIRELRNEKIDIIEYDEEITTFVRNALNPAKINQIVIQDHIDKDIDVIVEEDQLSLAIGKKGQNVRLASLLTGWNIDIKAEGDRKRLAEEQFEAMARESLGLSGSAEAEEDEELEVEEEVMADEAEEDFAEEIEEEETAAEEETEIETETVEEPDEAETEEKTDE